MEEAEEAARVQAEAALALGSALASAGGGHDVVCWRRPPLPSTTFPKHSSCDEIWRGLGERGSHDVKGPRAVLKFHRCVRRSGVLGCRNENFACESLREV